MTDAPVAMLSDRPEYTPEQVEAAKRALVPLVREVVEEFEGQEEGEYVRHIRCTLSALSESQRQLAVARGAMGVIATGIHAYADTLMIPCQDGRMLASRDSKEVRVFANLLDEARNQPTGGNNG